MIKRALLVSLVLIIPCSILAGCGSGTTATTPTTGSTTTTAGTTTAGDSTGTTATTGLAGAPSTTRPGNTSTTRAVAATGTIHLAEKNDGTTIQVAKGMTIVVVLSSTYWMFPDTAPALLQQVGGVTTVAAPLGMGPGKCLPGQGCGTQSVTYQALSTGQTQITASRTSCGEALLCTGHQGSYSVRVVISAR